MSGDASLRRRRAKAIGDGGLRRVQRYPPFWRVLVAVNTLLGPRRYPRSWCILVAISALLAAYALGIVAEVGYSANRNTSPPLAVSAGGVTLSVDHARYLILDTITVTLTNHSGAPIYLPEMGDGSSFPLCWFTGVEYQSADGWQGIANNNGCWALPACPSGMARGYGVPAVGVVAAGQTVVLDSYDGHASYPPLAPGAYRFSMVYSPTPLHAAWTSGIPDGVMLVTPLVTLTSAWWIPPWYHQTLDCPTNPLPV